MNQTKVRLLLVDDEESIRVPLARHLEREPYGYLVTAAAGFQEALQALESAEGHFDVALIDEALQGEGSSDGLELLRHIKRKYPDIECILFTGWGMRAGLEALEAGAYRYFAKPYNLEELALTIRFAAEEGRRHQERRFLQALVKVSQGLTQTRSEKEQLALAWNFVQEQLAVSSFFIALATPKKERVYFPLAFDEKKPVNLSDVWLGEDPEKWGLAGYVVKTGEEVLWSTLEERERVCKERGIRPRQEGKPSASCFCVPLVIGGEVHGVLSAQSYEPHIFTPSLQNALRALAGQLSVALENTRLMEDLRQRAADNELQARRIAALEQLAIDIASDLNLEEILQRTCQAAVEFFHADHSGLVLFDRDFLEGVVEAEYPARGAKGTIIPIRGIPLEERLIATREPIVIPDVTSEKDLGEVRQIMGELGIQSSLFVPVTGKSGLLGSFSLDAIQKPRTFADDEIELCKIFASQVAAAIENARLYGEVWDGQEHMHRLFNAGAAVIALRAPQEVLQTILVQACEATRAWRAAIVLVDEGGHPRVLEAYNFDQSPETAADLRREGISFQVIASGKPRFIEDVKASAREVHPAMLAEGVRAAACLPLPRQGKTIGVLWIHYREKHTFLEVEKQALQMYASLSAVAYDNACHVHELKQLREATEAMAREAEPERVLQRIVEGACRVLGAEIALIWPYDPNRDLFLPEQAVAEGIPADILEEMRREEPQAGLTTRHILDKGDLKVMNVETSPYIGDSTRAFLKRLGVIAFQGIRLEVAGERLGVLYVDYKTHRDFGQEEQRILEHFANHAALTLKKARLLEQIHRAREAARIVARVTTLGNLADTLKAVVQGAQQVLGADIVTLYRFDEAIQRFVDVEGIGYRDWNNLRPPDQVSRNSALWRVIEMGEPYYHPAENAPDDHLLQGEFVRKEGVQSALGIQLRFENERVGVMFINYRTPHRFQQAEIQEALQFAHQAAVAIRNAQLHEKLEWQTQTLRGLYEAGKVVTGLLDLEETLKRIVEQAWRLIGTQSRYVVMRLVEDETIAKVVAIYPPDLPSERAPIPVIDLRKGYDGRIGITGRAIQTGKTQLVNDVNLDPDYICSDPKEKAELVVPVRWGGKNIGVINVVSEELNAFNEEDCQTLEALANYAAIAIHNAQNHEKLKKQAASLDGLYRAAQSITATLSLEETLTRIAEQALIIVGADVREGCFSHVALREGSGLRFIAGWPPEILTDLHKNVGEIDLQHASRKGIAGYAVLTGQTQKVDEVLGHPEYIPLRENIDIHSQVSVPLQIGGQAIGVFSLEHPRAAAFSEADVHNLEALAAQAAVAIQNAKQYNELQKAYRDAEQTKQLLAARTAVAWIGMISSTWRHAIEKHAITIREQIALLREDLRKFKRKEITVDHRLDMIERLANQILEKPVSAPLSAEEGVSSIRVDDFVQERLTQLWKHYPYQEVSLQTYLDLKLSTTRAGVEWLRRAFDILIDNAVQATEGQAERNILVATRRIGNRAEIAVRDNGRGIPVEVQELLFRQPIPKSKGERGLGMGLLFAQMIVQTYGGEIFVGETGPTGTTMILSLPLEENL